MMKTLDVGCGNAKRQGSTGIDLVKLPGVDIVHDLNSFPWPIEDNFFDLVIMNDIIEHLEQPLKAMEEVYRILKPKGRVFARLIYWNHKYAASDPTHEKYFTEVSLEFFTGERRAYYTDAHFKLVKFKYIFDVRARRYIRIYSIMKFLAYYLNNVIQGMHFILEKE